MSDYLWEPGNAAPDPFVAELERRLAPLGDDLEDMLADLELDDANAEAREGVLEIVPLAVRPSPARERPRNWPWLAAAVASLGVSVGVFAHAQQASRTRSPETVVGAGGEGEIAGRVSLSVAAITSDRAISAHAALVELRGTHGALARCTLGLEPGVAVGLRVAVILDGWGTQVEVDEREGERDRELQACLGAALRAWDGAALGRAELQLDMYLHNNNQNREQD